MAARRHPCAISLTGPTPPRTRIYQLFTHSRCPFAIRHAYARLPARMFWPKIGMLRGWKRCDAPRPIVRRPCMRAGGARIAGGDVEAHYAADGIRQGI